LDARAIRRHTLLAATTTAAVAIYVLVRVALSDVIPREMRDIDIASASHPVLVVAYMVAVKALPPIVLLGMGYGIYRKSRACATIALILTGWALYSLWLPLRFQYSLPIPVADRVPLRVLGWLVVWGGLACIQVLGLWAVFAHHNTTATNDVVA
jgi:hypothetical protein